MYRPFLAAILLATFSTTLHAQISGRKLALLVGVKNYEHAQLDPLKYTENDVTDLAGILKKSGYTVVLMTETAAKDDGKLKPTLQNIRDQLKALTKGGKRDDTVVIGLSGHGIQFDEDSDNYFCPIDARPVKREKDSLLSFSEILKTLSDNGIGVKILLVDACRNDPNASRGIDTASIRPPKGSGVLFSCSKGQRAFESNELKHGVFFHFVLEGLKGKAVNNKGVVTWSSLTEYVSENVTTEVPKLIGEGARQEPNAINDLQGRSPTLVGKTRNPEALAAFQRGEDLFDREDYQQALEEYEKAVKLEPRDPEFLRSRGAARVELKDYSKAKRDLDAALQADPGFDSAFAWKALLAFRQRDYDAAIELNTEAIRLNPRYEQYLLNRADAHSQKGDYTRALKDCESALRLDPQSANAHNTKALILVEKGDLDDAIKAFDKAVLHGPKQPQYLVNRADAHSAKDDLESAEKDLKEALRLDRQFGDAWNGMGNLLTVKGEPADAVEHYTKAIAANPKVAMYFANRASSYSEIDKPDEAQKDLAQALKLDPECGFAYRVRGEMEMSDGKYDEALRSLSKAIEFTPRDSIAYRDRGSVQIDRKEYDKAIADLDKSIELNQKDAEAYYLRGNALTWKDEWAKAIKEYNKAIELNKEVASYFEARGTTFTELKKFDEALKDYDDALRLDDSRDTTWNYRGVLLLEHKNQAAEAVKSFSKAIALDPKVPLYWTNRSNAHDTLGNKIQADADRASAKELEKK